ncbi:MAG: PepSY domain-containing protein [Candidatus Contendobacter sp.]|nr:PepSY domain-containing protein [Candidatus Contendobacter sp.]MDG4557470.1 PepSY domain-containing protein [Candidatus Contendobacter sp.]
MNLRRLINAAALATIATTVTVAATAATAAGETPATPPSATTTKAAPAKTPITKEQAIEMALKAHPGKVTKAYEDIKKGKKTWEVKIKGDDSKKWEVYYEIATGELVAEEAD